MRITANSFLTLFFLLHLCSSVSLQAQDLEAYPHDSIRVTDLARKPHGLWLFEPMSPQPDSAPVIVFLHGYGGYNPMIYGGWIKHLVLQGNTVIFPRYQRNLIFPRPPRFVRNTSKAIHRAMDTLQQEGRVHPFFNDGPRLYVGHSYGGVVAANIAVNYERWDLPEPEGLLLLAPGSGPFKGAVLKDYTDLSDSLQLAIVLHEHDHVVGDQLGRLIFEHTVHLMDRHLIEQEAVHCGPDTMSAHHNESYSVDLSFDTGLRNYTAKKALRVGETDVVDRELLWPLLDDMRRRIFYRTDSVTPISEEGGQFYWPLRLGAGCEEIRLTVLRE